MATFAVLTPLAACNNDYKDYLGLNNTNSDPTADAGASVSADERTLVRLTGSGTDSDGTVVRFEWRQIAGPSVTLQNADTAAPTFNAPEVAADTLVGFSLTVTDDDGATATDTTEVSIRQVNQPPSLSLEASDSVVERSTTALTAEAQDPDNDPLIFLWRQVSGPTGSFSDTSSKNTDFTAPTVSSPTSITLELKVDDGQGGSITEQIQLSILDSTPLRLLRSTPDFGTAGAEVTLTFNEAPPPTLTVVLGRLSIAPDEISGNTAKFLIPDGAQSGPLTVQFDGQRTNQLLFSAETDGLLPPATDKLLTDDAGTQLVSDYLIVRLAPADDNRATAERLAMLVSGTVIGRVSALNWWQISVSADDIATLDMHADTLEADPAVITAMTDSIIKNDAIDWSLDPQLGAQRDRNNVEEGAALYEDNVGFSSTAKAIPFFMSVGVSESGIDFDLPDFSEYLEDGSVTGDSVAIYAPHAVSSATVQEDGNHGSNVVGVIAGELGDGANAGLLAALEPTHGGANIVVDGSFTVAQKLESTLSMAKNGASVINWSWGLHRKAILNFGGPRTCDGRVVENNQYRTRTFERFAEEIDNFFNEFEEHYPNVLIVASAGNGATDAGDEENRLPSSIESEQMIVVGAHTSGYNVDTDDTQINEDAFSAFDAQSSCYNTDGLERADISGTPVRASYSNYGQRVDITASGSIVGFENNTLTGTQGTSYSTPLVAATAALIQSINPNLSPSDILALLRESALPIENAVALSDEDADSVVTRPLTEAESPTHAGKGARLNVSGAITAALATLEDSTLVRAETIGFTLPGDQKEVTRTVEVTIPGDRAVFDKVDIMFLVDVSSSYSDDLGTFRSQASDLLDAFDSTGTNVQVGLASFIDFPRSPYGRPSDYAFRLDQALTSDLNEVRTALNALRTGNGANGPESQLEALFNTAHDNSGWREGALPIIFLATDAGFNDSDVDSNYPGTGRSDTLAALKNRKARVYGLQSGGSISDVETISADTGGTAFDLSRDSAEIVAAVNDAITESSTDLSVNLIPSGDFSGAVRSIRPASQPTAADGTPIESVNAGDTIQFAVTFSVEALQGLGLRQFAFRLLVNADDVAVIQEVPVILNVETPTVEVIAK